MINLIVMLKRKPGTTREEFRSHYETCHVELARRYVGHLFHDYRRNYVYRSDWVTHEQYAIGEQGGDVDVVTIITFKDQADVDEFFRLMAIPEIGDAFREDEEKFLDRTRMVIALADEARTWTAITRHAQA